MPVGGGAGQQAFEEVGSIEVAVVSGVVALAAEDRDELLPFGPRPGPRASARPICSVTITT